MSPTPDTLRLYVAKCATALTEMDALGLREDLDRHPTIGDTRMVLNITLRGAMTLLDRTMKYYHDTEATFGLEQSTSAGTFGQTDRAPQAAGSVV